MSTKRPFISYCHKADFSPNSYIRDILEDSDTIYLFRCPKDIAEEFIKQVEKIQEQLVLESFGIINKNNNEK